ncbi:MAG: molybdopterin-dependent oxidoreductase [Halanaeroarchaeum sp.]
MGTTLPAPRSRDGIGLSLLAGVVAVAGSYAAVGRSDAFVAVPVHAWEVDHMPAVVLRIAIVALGKLGEDAGFILALALTVLLFAAVAAVALAVGEDRSRLVPLGSAYLLSWVVATLLTRAPWAALGVTLPMTAVLALSSVDRRRRSGAVDGARREVIRTVGGVGAIGLGFALGNRTPLGTPPKLSAISAADRATIQERLDMAAERSLSVGDLPGLVSPIRAFYEVDINTVNPGVDLAEWSLSVTGAVDDPLEVGYGDLTGRDADHRFYTLRCVGEDLNGHKMDNALWTGVPAATLLDEAGVDDDATHVVLHAVDGYYEEFPLHSLEQGFLAYGMNGRELPRAHGAPVRALVPGRWGEVNVKWLTEIEVIAGEATGYWEKRGWEGTGPVTTVAKLHEVVHHDDGRITVGGHAYAGTRGIARVEVSTDGGDSWSKATLSEPLPGDDVWRMWSFTYEPPGDAHEVVVRAVDGTGDLQTKINTAAFPSGATGWVSQTIAP